MDSEIHKQMTDAISKDNKVEMNDGSNREELLRHVVFKQ